MQARSTGAKCFGNAAIATKPADKQPSDPCPACKACAPSRYCLVLGEFPEHMDRIERPSAPAILLSPSAPRPVYPAAGSSICCAPNWCQTLELTLEPSRSPRRFHAHPTVPRTEWCRMGGLRCSTSPKPSLAFLL